MGAPPNFRWELAEADRADPQGTLFDDVVERHIGRGEYRGLEFLHVNAHRIINEVPAASRMPFRFTINAYRGCSHACSYCMAGDTPILLANGRTKPLGELRVGDEIYGTLRRGAHRRYVKTGVEAHWSTVKPAFRVVLEDGTELVTSGDHRLLTDHGWKYVARSVGGPLQRSYLTTNTKVLGTGQFATPPDYGPGYQRGYLCGVVRGNGHLGPYRYERWTDSAHDGVHRFRPAVIDLDALRRTRDYLADLDGATTKFLLQAAVGAWQPTYAVRTSAPVNMAVVGELVRWPPQPSVAWQKGFLAGIFDAEGSYGGGILRLTHADRRVLDVTTACLTALGFRFRVDPNATTSVRLLGGMRSALHFFHLVDPAITRKRAIEGQPVKSSGALQVKSVEPLGANLPLFDITTGTGDFIANGVVSHNCFARPSHEYLGMNAGDDFDRRIVVKINAVERLRAELSPARWGGHHIAMGTNTDPYQRCEGKYRLTQGIIKELMAAANPFSLLTKSTLILRDLDLLAEAARSTDVQANFSIGTLDEEVWRLTEPGTPHPRRRVEAVARLNEAGVPCGVLVAPVLPGLSDRPDQLEAVVKACVEAGATMIAPILLHLRPGVREHYLDWLAGARPDLLPHYEDLYPTSYAPKDTQQSLSRQVARLVERHGGRRARPSDTRTASEKRARLQRAASSPKPQQLSFL